MSESFDITIKLDDREVDILHQIKAKVNKDGYDWNFNQILTELAAIGLANWSRMQMLAKITPKGDGFD